MRNDMTDFETLMRLVAKFHSILGIAWPKPGVHELAGASVFIGTTLFNALADGLNRIESVLENSSCCTVRTKLTPFWHALKRLFTFVGKQDRYSKSGPVDSALNLLYLASGVFYHRLAELSSKQPEMDVHPIEVEEFKELLRLCRWSAKADDVESVFDSLVEEMTACAAELEQAANQGNHLS